MPCDTAPGRPTEVADALRASRLTFIGVGVMSSIINILYLTGSIFMLEIYDRVLPSRSVPTLFGLVVLAVLMYAAQAALDILRGRILIRVGTSLDEKINRLVFETFVHLPLVIGERAKALQPLRDLDTIRAFFAGQGPGAFFDLPWLPFYLAICFFFHWLLGVTALAGAVVLLALALATELTSRAPVKGAVALAVRRTELAHTSQASAEVLVAMGMAPRLTQR